MGNENLKTVYDQYWLHARHIEQEIWSFTTVYAVIIGAIFAAVGTNISLETKIGITGFGALLSLLGFLLICTQYLAFLKFVLTAELIAINEFKIKEGYRRFFSKKGKVFPQYKKIDTYDILAVFYSALIGVMSYLSIDLFVDAKIWIIIPTLMLAVILAGIYFVVIRKNKVAAIIKQLTSYVEDL